MNTRSLCHCVLATRSPSDAHLGSSCKNYAQACALRGRGGVGLRMRAQTNHILQNVQASGQCRRPGDRLQIAGCKLRAAWLQAARLHGCKFHCCRLQGCRQAGRMQGKLQAARLQAPGQGCKPQCCRLQGASHHTSPLCHTISIQPLQRAQRIS